MNRNILNQVGCSEFMDMIDQYFCPVCGKTIYQKDFKNELSIKEYTISGLCQKCQDEMLG